MHVEQRPSNSGVVKSLTLHPGRFESYHQLHHLLLSCVTMVRNSTSLCFNFSSKKNKCSPKTFLLGRYEEEIQVLANSTILIDISKDCASCISFCNSL